MFQNDLTEELTIENSNVVSNSAATLGVLENKPSPKEQSEYRSRETRKRIWEKLYHQVTEDKFVEKMRNNILETLWHQLVLIATNPVSHLTSADKQLKWFS